MKDPMHITFEYDWDGFPLQCQAEYWPGRPGTREYPEELGSLDLLSVSHQGGEVPVDDTYSRHRDRLGILRYQSLRDLIVDAGLAIVEDTLRERREDEAFDTWQERNSA